MENTLENKSKFFALYWGQEIGRIQIVNGRFETKEIGIFPAEPKSKCLEYIELKPLSSITDEELLCIAKFYEPTAHNVKLEDDQIVFDFIYGDQGASGAIEISDGYCLDWLRCNGYALPWMALSVEKLVEHGWIKLVES